MRKAVLAVIGLAAVAALMVPVYLIISLNDRLRGFFEVTQLSALDYVLVGLLSAVWALAMREIWKYRLFDRFFGYAG